MTLYVSVVGAGLLLSQRAGTPHPPERWGANFTAILAAEWQGFLVGVGTSRDPSSLPTLFSRIRWASAKPERSGPGSRGAWTSERGVSTWV